MVSFFEKLTGSISMDKKIEPEPEAEIEIDAEETLEEDPKEEVHAETASVKGATLTRGKEKKDWNSLQVEGQLTVDIYEKGDKIIIQSAVAGTDPDDIDITLTHDMITIKGTRKQSEEVHDKNYFYRELYWGAFSRSIILPEEVDETKAEASIKNGVLTVKLPKKQLNGQRLKVKAE